jgi:hypothetical protein
MKFTRFAAAGLPAVALLTAIPLAAHASAHPAAHPAAPATGIVGCDNKPVVKPGNFDVFCDGSWFLSGLKWTAWNGTEAIGTGVSNLDNCIPNCATGHWTKENAVVVFWRPATIHHQNTFTRITALYPRTGRTQTVPAPGAYGAS